ncbi:bifunctional precorrin-2 dehydrogenase/sirohydrochlorin ferrochelatase [Paenibacillaceae bacterium]|nr:bifunctional precorrin-2 dehydrogenase/sirohydrochlorin ferrochelatase [Paenibacillaceae bacterium]
MSRYYPIMLNIEQCKCVVVGGGTVALRKIAGLAEAGAKIVAIAPEPADKLRQMALEGSVELVEREYREEDLADAVLVFTATNRGDVNAQVTRDAARRGIPVNTADAGHTGTFTTPAVLRRGDLLLAVSTSGASPALASRIQQELAVRYGEEYAAYTMWLRELRTRLLAAEEDQHVRRKLLGLALDIPKPEHAQMMDEASWSRQIALLRRELQERSLTFNGDE